jgi:hypothetical protein
MGERGRGEVKPEEGQSRQCRRDAAEDKARS